LGPLTGGLIGIGSFAVLPIVCGTLGLPGGLLVSWLYNLPASLVGGIEEEVTERPASPRPLRR